MKEIVDTAAASAAVQAPDCTTLQNLIYTVVVDTLTSHLIELPSKPVLESRRGEGFLGEFDGTNAREIESEQKSSFDPGAMRFLKLKNDGHMSNIEKQRETVLKWEVSFSQPNKSLPNPEPILSFQPT